MKLIFLAFALLYGSAPVCAQWQLDKTDSAISVRVFETTEPCRARTLDLRAINADDFSGTLSYVANTGQTRSSDTTFSEAACGTGWGGEGARKREAVRTLSIQTDSSGCMNLWWAGYFASENRQWQIVLDSLTMFIDSCANNTFAPTAFPKLSTAVAGLYGPRGGTYRATFRDWLESVLYLDTTNPEYFCADVEVLASTMPLPHDTAPGARSRETNIPLSVIRWLLLNTTCDTPQLWQEYEHSRLDQLEEWANDPTKYQLDTTLSPLDSIQPGLLELLEMHSLYAEVNPLPNAPAILSNAIAAPNPADAGTVISFTMNREAYVRITLFDVLGKQLGSSAFESFFGTGNKSVPILLVGLPSGTYYARIQTAYGEVQTVKLVKE